MLKLKESQFCGMSRSKAWLEWIAAAAKDLHDDLVQTHKSGRGCRANREKMLSLRKALYDRGMGSRFEEFILKTFPFLIEREEPKQQQATVVHKTVQSLPVPSQSKDHRLNKHKIFKYYRPDLLKFPHQLIIQDGDPKELERKVKEFVSDKIGVEILVIEDTAYIEYVMPKFADVLSKMSPKLYEIKAHRCHSSIK